MSTPSSSDYDNIRFITRQVNFYGCLFVFILGIFGELLTIIVFATLKTFRQMTCSFYLVTASIANIGTLIVIFLQIIYDGLNTGFIYTSFICKFRFFLAQYGTSVSMTSLCLAIIDQFISMTTCKHWSSLKIARRLVAIISVFWFISSLFNFIYYEYQLNKCLMINSFFAKYYTYFQSPLCFGLLTIIIMIIFSLLAFIKIRSIASRQLNIVRLSRDRQLTAMTLFQVWFVVITYIPFLVMFIYNLTVITHEPIDILRKKLISTIVIILFYLGYSSPFYIYCCVSKRFRKQVIYVFIRIHLNGCRDRLNRIKRNQVASYPMEMINSKPISIVDIKLD